MSRNAARDDAKIGDFIISSEIGKGSFAVVHKGYRQQTKEPVAIKIVTRKKLTAKLLDNLEGEIAILKAINHPNIVELKDCLKTDSHIHLVMAFCSAGDLSQYIRKRYDIHALGGSQGNKSALSKRGPSKYPHPEDGGLNETIVRSILTQLAGALAFMRGRDIVHRDIKPQNLLLQPPEQAFVDLGNPTEIPQVKVADFGFARHLGSNVLAETLCGSPLYMAPEILRYEKYDAKADLWSVGAVLFEMSVGAPPFKANNHVELLRRIEKGEDKIKFPDERSAGSLAREAARRQEAGEAPLPPPHPVSGDIKTLIRKLLRQRPVERMSFDDFFRSPVIEDYLTQVKPESASNLNAADPADSHVVAHSASVTGSQTMSASDAAAADEEGNNSKPRRERSSQDHGSRDADSRSPAKRRDEEASAPARPTPPPSVPKAFATRYVVGDGGISTTTALPQTGNREKDAAPQPAQAASATKEASPSRRSSSTTGRQTSTGGVDREDTAEEAFNQDTGRGEDSFLGREYVMVEKRNVEVNALADELAASPQQPQNSMARRPSRLSRLSSGMATAPSSASDATSVRLSSTPPGGVWPSSGGFALPPGTRPSTFARRTSLSSSGSPSPRLTSQPMPVIEAGSSGNAIGPPAIESGSMPGSSGGRPVYSASPSSTTPSSALARAISMASLRLFGVPSGMSLRGAAALVRSRSHRRTALLRTGEAADAAESGLIATLEDLGQKSFVLSEFADSKLAGYFPVGPHQLAQDLDSSSMTGGVGGSPGRASGTSHSGTTGLAGRRMSSTSSVSSAFDAGAAETAAAEALVLYVKSLSFLQRAINTTKAFLETRSKPGSPATASVELNGLVQWLRARFNEGYDKADFARSKCGEIPESAQHVDRLVFNRALEVARAAAMDELENNRDGGGWDPNQCLLAYETANSMLMALLDAGEEGMALSDGSIGTIEKFVKSINKRLVALQARFGGGSKRAGVASEMGSGLGDAGGGGTNRVGGVAGGGDGTIGTGGSAR